MEAEKPESESKRGAPEEQLWEANQGRVKGNKQKAEYEEPGKKAWETRQERTGKTEEAKAESGAPGKPL